MWSTSRDNWCCAVVERRWTRSHLPSVHFKPSFPRSRQPSHALPFGPYVIFRSNLPLCCPSNHCKAHRWTVAPFRCRDIVSAHVWLISLMRHDRILFLLAFHHSFCTRTSRQVLSLYYLTVWLTTVPYFIPSNLRGNFFGVPPDILRIQLRGMWQPDEPVPPGLGCHVFRRLNALCSQNTNQPDEVDAPLHVENVTDLTNA